jgi:hypothetical protein
MVYVIHIMLSIAHIMLYASHILLHALRKMLRVTRIVLYVILIGQDSSVGVPARYGLEDPGIKTRQWQDFPHQSRPALGTNQPTVQYNGY